MSVDTPDSKRTYTCKARQFAPLFILHRLPILCVLHDVERTVFQLKVRIQRLGVQTFHQCFMLHLQQYFDNARNARS
ncbi:hypothetical protein D3C73_538480 [compost metagenome]